VPRTCTICTHPVRAEIDRALIAGESVRAIASRYVTISHMTVQRHKEEHLPATLLKARAAEDVAHAIDVVRQLKAINGASVAILSEARRTNDPDTALRAIDRIQRQIELQAKLLGQLDERPQVNVLVGPDGHQIRALLVASLALYGEALMAVAGAPARMAASDACTLGSGGPACRHNLPPLC